MTCQLCMRPIAESEDRCEFAQFPHVFFHAACVLEHGAGRAHDIAENIADTRRGCAGCSGRQASQLSVTVAADPGPDSDYGPDGHEPFCYCADCLRRKGR